MQNRRKTKTIITGATVFFVAFFAAFFASSVLTPTNTSDATTDTITANVDAQGYYVKISSSDVAMDLTTTPGGAMTVVGSTVKTATNSPSGYQLYIGMSPYYASGTEKSAADKLKNGLYLEGDLSRTDGSVFTAASGSGGTSGTLAALSNNTWGYAVDKNSTGAPDIWTTENHSTMTSATPTDDKFAAVPPAGSEELIQITDTANVPIYTPASSIDFTDPSTYTEASVYYGIRGTNAKASGAYSNTIAYTAIAQAAQDAGITAFTPEKYTRDATYESMVWDDTVTIETSLYTNMQDLGTATVTLSGGPTNAQNLICANPTLASVNNLLTVTCTLPQGYAGTYKVTVHLNKFDQTFTDTYTYAATWDTISAMQEMTSSICAEPQTPNTDAASSSTTLSAAQFTGTVVPEKFLTDLRGGGGHVTGTFQSGYGYQEAYTGKYRIRKLADGNCWMTENMDLPFNSTSTFYSYNTNLAVDPNDSSIDLDSYSVAADGTIAWTPKAVGTVAGGDSTCTVYNTSTSKREAVDCSPDTISAPDSSWSYPSQKGPIDSNGKNAHNYQGTGKSGTKTTTTNDNPAQIQDIGTYYNYASAAAQSSNITAGTDAPNSLCPKGWRLPSGGDDSTAKSFAALMNNYGYTDSTSGSAAVRKFPVSFVYSGFYLWRRGFLESQGGASHFWTSSLYSDNNSRELYITSERIYYQNLDWPYGLALRCVQN